MDDSLEIYAVLVQINPKVFARKYLYFLIPI